MSGLRRHCHPRPLTARAALRARLFEVQRPLATVVIGGLVTATLLTFLVLPVVYAWLGESRAPRPEPAATT